MIEIIRIFSKLKADNFLILVCLLSLPSLYSVAQENCKAKDFFLSRDQNCINMLQGANCASIDISESIDSAANNFIYEWDMGDGTKKRGYKIDHCYSKFGNYKAVLNLYDSINDILYPKELVVELVIREPLEITIHAPDTISPGETKLLNYELSKNKTYNVTSNFWNINDQNFLCDKQIELSSAKPAWNRAQVLILLESAGETFEICASGKMWGKASNINGKALVEVFENSNPSPFASDQVHFAIYDVDSDKVVYSTYPVTSNDDMVLVEKGANYYMIAWKGNQISEKIDFTTSGCSDSTETFTIIKESFNKLISKKPIQLKPLYFEFDKLEIDKKHKKNLEANIKIIKKYPYMRFKVGTYTHTGGLVDRNLRLAAERSGYLLKYLIDKGIEQERIEVVDPSTDSSLINTCFDSFDCSMENQMLNKRSDFVVIGF